MANERLFKIYLTDSGEYLSVTQNKFVFKTQDRKAKRTWDFEQKLNF